MSSERFEVLRNSVIEAGLIMQGKQRPSREFILERPDSIQEPDEIWAVCLDSDDPELLIPRKLYLVKFTDSGVWVRDEKGETVVCDKEDFLPLSLAHEVEELLEAAA